MSAVSPVYIAPVSFGLGDLVVSLPAVQALIAEGAGSGEETWLVARSAGQRVLSERIEGLAGCIDEDAFDPPGPGRFVDLRDHPLQRDHWWGSPEFDEAFGPLTINDILARICADFGIGADFSRPVPLRAHDRAGLHDSVLLVTESDGPMKRWPAACWSSVAARIRAQGAEVRLVTRDEPSAEMRAAGIEALRAPTPGDAVDVLGACRAVVGVDTGLTHIAVQQGTPTVTLFRPRPVYFRPWPHCRAVTGERCQDECLAVEREYAYNARVSLRGFRWTPRSCPVGGRCLDTIEPDQVVATLAEML